MAISRRDFAINTLAAPLALAASPQPRTERDRSLLQIRDDHDLNLPLWGPYTKKYFGISHIPEPGKGLRFDVGFFPGFFRRTPLIPNVLWESGYHPWEATPDLSYYSTRFELEWKDRVYVDLAFAALDPDARIISCHVVNQTDADENLSLHLMASMQFPFSGYRVDLPPGALWVDALDYDDLRFAVPRPTDTLVPDGLLRAEVRGANFTGGSGIGQRFGADRGDTVAFSFELKNTIPDAVLLLRYRCDGDTAARFQLEGAAQGPVNFPPVRAFSVLTIPVTNLSPGKHRLQLTSAGGASVEFDGFAIVESSRTPQVGFSPVLYTHQPEILTGPNAGSLLLKYKDAEPHYGLAWDFNEFQIREFLCDDLDNVFRYHTHDHVNHVIKGAGDGHYTDIFLRPVTLAPKSSRTIWGLVCSGSREKVTRTLTQFPGRRDLESIRDSARQKRANPATTTAGATYAFSQERMAATTLSNVVYPVHIRRHEIRHNTPGRWWDSFYTWDSGFCGLGLLEHDLGRAVDCLNTYTFPPGDPYAAFLEHGTPVAVQIYLFQEIWNRTQSRPLLEYFYPRLRQMHFFLAGRLGSSTTRRLTSQLITTWDYFYNTGGWDDYPPQQYVHSKKLTRSVAPIANTAHAIRTAKILRMAALALGHRDDVLAYESDIAIWKDALQNYAWDQESGYFGYVVHDAEGRPTSILRDPGGVNFNMGIDGITPLLAGVCTASQVDTICRNLMSDTHLWTPIGVTTVDQSAPYHRNDGYWNGAVWMPHQWFIWRALWDLGRIREANRIARTALDLWKAEVETSYNCFEHFLVQSGCGAGWHQFSGLSCPVMCWFGAYHRPGRLTTGFDVWVSGRTFAPDYRSFQASLELHGDGQADPAVLVTMAPSRAYRVRWAREEAHFMELLPGVLQVTLAPSTKTVQQLTIDCK
jgi:hypothetical protein